MVNAGKEVADVAFQHPAVSAAPTPAVVIHHVGFQAHQAVVRTFVLLAGEAVPDEALG